MRCLHKDTIPNPEVGSVNAIDVAPTKVIIFTISTAYIGKEKKYSFRCIDRAKWCPEIREPQVLLSILNQAELSEKANQM